MSITDKFCYRAYLTCDRSASLCEISFTDYKNFVKVLTNNDIDIVNMFIDGLISKILVSDDVTLKDLSVLDKLIILLNVRAFCIEPTVKFEFNDDDKKKKFTYTVDINKIAEHLSLISIEDEFEVKKGNISTLFKLPTRFVKATTVPELFLQDSLTKLIINNSEIDIESSSIFQKLPIDFSTQFCSFLTDNDSKVSKVPVINYKANKKNYQLRVSFLDNSMLSLLKLLYETSLADIYETEYALFKNYNFTQEIFDTRSPAEIYLYIAIIKEQNQKSQKDAKAHQYINPEAIADGSASVE